MSCYLCIRVVLLDERFHGRASDGEPEWPPSPWRLYQALVAGGHAGCRSATWSERESAAMRWLAELEPPTIVTPDSVSGRAHTLWVPNNDFDVITQDWATGVVPKKSPAELRTAKHTCPTIMLDPPDGASPGGSTVAWLYRVDDQSDFIDHAPALKKIASGVHSLGWGVDSAVATVKLISSQEVDQLAGQRWEPAPPTALTGRILRSPAPDALDQLTHCHESFRLRLSDDLYRPPDRPGERAFSLIGYVRRTDTRARPAVAFALRIDGSDAWFRGIPTRTNQIAAMLRHVACERSISESDRFPGGSHAYVRGKIDQSVYNPPRFSYLPLPTVGFPNADGLIRRALIAEQVGGDGSYAVWIAQRLRGASLIDERSRQPVAVLEAMTSNDSVIRRYVGPSTTWSTVTPIILPGFDDHRHRARNHQFQSGGSLTKVERLFLKSLQQAGLCSDALKNLTLRKPPFWSGSHHPDEYTRPDYLDKKNNRRFPAWHVRVEFRGEVSGPLAIGAGRHCGLGLFAAENVD